MKLFYCLVLVSLIASNLAQPVENDEKVTNVKNSNQESEKNDKVDKKEEKTENKVPVDLPDESSYDNDESYNYDYGDNHCHDLICNTDDLQPLWGINSNTVIKKYKVCEVFANRGCIERAACEFKRGAWVPDDDNLCGPLPDDAKSNFYD